VNYRTSNRSPFLANSATPSDYAHSEATVREIDVEVKRIIDEAGRTVHEILTQRQDVLEHMSRELMEREIMDAEHLKRILDEHVTSPHIKPGTYVATTRDTEAEPESPIIRKTAEGG